MIGAAVTKRDWGGGAGQEPASSSGSDAPKVTQDGDIPPSTTRHTNQGGARVGPEAAPQQEAATGREADPSSGSGNDDPPNCALSTLKEARNRACPFESARHFEADGKRWCAFHMPVEASDGTPTAKATWTHDELNEFMLTPIGELLKEAASGSAALDLSFSHFPKMALLKSSPAPSIAEGPGCSIKFDHAVFHDAVFFQLRFGPSTSFHHTRFKARADFRGSVFVHDAYLWNAVFDDIAQFMGVVFFRSLNMGTIVFNKSADFTDATFGDGITMHNAKFHGDLIFAATGPKAELKGITQLLARRAEFLGEARFMNRDFFGVTDFRESTFAKAPDFHGCLLHQATSFPRRAAFQDIESPEAASRYRTLFQAMGNVRDHENEAMFFALQQETLRRSMKWYEPLRAVSWVYDKASDYGQSIARPLVLFISTQLLFGLVYFGLGACHQGALEGVAGAAAVFTGQQVFRPFFVWTDSIDKWPRGQLAAATAWWPFVLATVQTLVSILAIYFLALGTRWRFRRW